MATLYLSFGSNIGDRALNIEKSAARLAEKAIKIKVFSALYETEPMHNKEQPKFINCCVKAETALSPMECLKAVKETEKEMGRAHDTPRYSPRIIDIDILYYDNIIIKSAELTIPHPQMRGRRFVLAPLSEIAPDFADPLSGMTVKEALKSAECAGKVVKMENI